MYLTKPITRTAPVVQQPLSCPEACQPSLYADFNFLGLIFGLACLVIYFTQKHFLSGVRLKWKKHLANLITWLWLLLAALAVFYTLQITYYNSTKEGCPKGNIMASANLLPDFFRLPFTWQK